MILTGESLAERQHDLNKKVNDAAAKNVPFEEFMETDQSSDVDKLFKIDLASKYKNIDYIIEVLKSGDALYISRALKCLWLYDAEYKSYINPNYLQENVFALMSAKMMKKFLVKIGTYVTNEDQAEEFYKFCVQKHMIHFSFNFLIKTSAAFKMDIINNNTAILDSFIRKNKKYIVFLIGNDFTLAKAYLRKRDAWFSLRYLYSVDAEQYLSMVETILESQKSPNGGCLGVKTSKDIMTKHKSRTFEKIHIYYSLLHFKTFLKHVTLEDAKIYAVGLLPKTSQEFWSCHYRNVYSPILDKIPDKDKYHFFKTIYETKYSDGEFEMSRGFYKQFYFDLMTVDERESWALRYIEGTKKSFLSEEEDKEYLWYRFVNYDRAVAAIKKYVLITPEPNKRSIILEILIECTRNQDHLQNMFEYYYERHINEDRCIKERFIKKVIKRECIWEFNVKCWEAFNKLLNSIELFNEQDNKFNSYESKDILIPVLFYYVINKQELPKVLQDFVNGKDSVEKSVSDEYIRKIKDINQRITLYEFLRELYTNKILNEIKDRANFFDHYLLLYIDFTKRILNLFEKTNEELSDVVNFIISISKKESETQYAPPIKPKRETLNDIICELKKKTRSIPSIWEDYNFKRYYKVGLLKKLKVYFSHDVADDFFKYFSKFITEYLKEESISKRYYCPNETIRKLKTATHGIFILADERFKSEFMSKYAPIGPKIDYKTIDRKHLYIQEAICLFVYYSRPRVPLELVRPFVKGDYIHYCAPLLYNFTTNLPMPQCLQFINILLNAPVSMQKHGLRLAFECFSLDNIKNLILKTWKKSKNISLRMVIYTHLVNNIIHKRDNLEQTELFEVLLTLTSQLNSEDHCNVLKILTNNNNFPEHFISPYLKTAWETVNTFPDDDNLNLRRRVSVLDNITNNIRYMNYNAVYEIVDDFIKNIKDYILKHDVNIVGDAKYNLTTTFFAKYDERILNNMTLVRNILSTCCEMWNDILPSNTNSIFYFSRSFCHKFIHDLEIKHFSLKNNKYTQLNELFEKIAQILLDALPFLEVYLLQLGLRFLCMTNIILDTFSKTEFNINKHDIKNITSAYADEVVKIINWLDERQKFSVVLLKDVTVLTIHFAGILNDSLIITDTKNDDISTYYNDTVRGAHRPRRQWVKWNPKARNQFRGTRPLTLTTRPTESIPHVPFTSLDNILTCVAKKLVSYSKTEIKLLALNILPPRITPESAEEYNYVIETVKTSNDFAVQASYYQKTIIAKFK